MKRLLEISCKQYINKNSNNNNTVLLKTIKNNIISLNYNKIYKQPQPQLPIINSNLFVNNQIQSIFSKRSFCNEFNKSNDQIEEIKENNETITKTTTTTTNYKRVVMKPISDKPIIAIIGKPNVGKSTIFNRIIEGQRQALVEEIPGTTRDRYYGEGFLYGREFVLVDTGGLIGESKEDKDQFQGVIHDQAEIAMEEADAILFVLDFKSGITSVDKELARMLRSKKLKTGKPIYIGVNKADNVAMRLEQFQELKTQIIRLGFGEPIAFSAQHGDGIHQMFENILKGFPHMNLSDEKLEQDLKPGPIKISIVGQPNAGKSSLMNKIIEEERSIVSDIPGTTHDPVDCNFLWRDKHELTLIDTAGIRRRSTHKVGLEKSSVLWALKAIEKSHVVFLVIDATVGLTEQDLKIAGFVVDSKKSMVIIVNKWDLYLQNKKTTQKLSDKLFFHDFQKNNSCSSSSSSSFNSSSKSFSESSFQSNFTLNSLLDDLIAENKKKSKTDDNILVSNNIKKKKSSILEEKKKRKQQIKEEQEQEQQEIQQQHSSDLDYSKIYWPDSVNDNKEYQEEIDGIDDEEFDFDIDSILRENENNNNNQDEEIEQDDDEKFQKAYIEYLKRKEARQEELEKLDLENGGNGKVKRAPPPEVTLPKLTKVQKEFESEIRSKLTFLDFAPILFTSAKTGFCVPTAIDLSIKIFFEREKKLRVSHLIEIIRQVTFKHKFPKKGKNALKLKFAQQVKGYPPTFVFWVNNPDDIEPSIVRYLLRSIRETYPYVGTPIYIRFKKNIGKKRRSFNKSSSSSSSSNNSGSEKRYNNSKK